MAISNAMKTLVLVMVVTTDGIQLGEENDLFGKSAHCSKCYDYSQMWCRVTCGPWCEWHEGDCYDKGTVDDDAIPDGDFDGTFEAQARGMYGTYEAPTRPKPVAEPKITRPPPRTAPQSRPLQCCYGMAKDHCSSCRPDDWDECSCWAKDGTQCGRSNDAFGCRAVSKCKLCAAPEVNGAEANRLAEMSGYANEIVAACLSQGISDADHHKFMGMAARAIQMIADEHRMEIGNSEVLRAARQYVCQIARG